MGKFFSIGGMSHNGQRQRRYDYGKLADDLFLDKIQDDPRYSEFLEARKNRNLNDAPDVPFQEGDQEVYRGEKAEIIGRDYDDHRGVTSVHIRQGSKEYATEFERVSEHAVEIARSRRIL